ncbi:TPM domain-containing protein [Allosphingosinicella indica]|uniref:TLP18.3, Psb32 and MOLO-1 founding protein of phosphatase n=1 Tax=Allosphingosinicella indica TaxID=941907 RepID=A0A1X7G043_9SPHN|nr:TPM domain-containing protein [Allosphingosinicella indica]SMF61367.1 TLP18.3, Psb32 and MOLO-1 founding protein of phosphatase [Allosphingosinicella indica]
MGLRILSTAAAAGAALLGGCDAPEVGQSKGKLTDADRVEAIAATLQACSYDGRPVEAPPGELTGAAPDDCSLAVKRIMGFTGLPANFTVVSGPVDNAAAVILLDDQRIPRRVIAFNPRFMTAAQQQAGGTPWGPMSVMAHEIAHHLSGHTITPGGSRPEIELEADKFSGFVLHKMGAPLADATRMILAVGSDHASPTHPAKAARADAIRQGWTESCRQGGGADCSGAAVQPTQTPAVITAGPARALPAPGSIPFKYGRFVYDETGKLDPARAKAIDQQLYTLARDAGAEFAILVVNDLKGMSAQDYAWAMMRQLRVGKLDVGNGGVAVVAPRQRQAAVAFGPGFAKEAEFSNPERQLLTWIDAAWPYCDDADGCLQWTDNLIQIFRLTLANASQTKWTIQFQTLGQLLAHYDRVNNERMQVKRPFNPDTDQPLGNLLRLNGRITSLNPPTGIGQVNDKIVGGELGYKAVSLMTDDGYPVILYVSPRLAGLMPSGEIREGQRYTLVGRLQRTGDKDKQASALWLFSYDAL